MKKKLIVITGANAGIGQALAHQFLFDDHPCLLLSRTIKPLPAFANKKVKYAQVDVTDYQQFEQAVRAAEAEFGPVECLVNNAGLINVGTLREMPIEQCQYELDVLVKGVLNGIKIVLNDMAARKSGTIFNISSIGDRKPSPLGVVYHASKHAVRSISESLQMAEAKNNVRIMNIAPGLVKTNIHQNMGISFDEYCKMLGNPTFIEAEELADIIYYCWKLPQKICIRDLVIMPTDCDY